MNSFDYERVGVTVSLIPDEAYYQKFLNDTKKFNVWENHSVFPYFFLVSNMNLSR